MINVLVIVMEGIAAWLCLHCAFGEKIKKSKGEIIFFLFYISLFALCSFGILSRLFYILFWLFAFIWCKVMFGRKKLSTIVRTAIGIVAVGVIELIVMFIYTFLAFNVSMSMEIECMLVGGILLFFTIVIYGCTVSCRKETYKQIFDGYFCAIVLCTVVFLLYAKFEFEENKAMPIVYVFFFLILSIIFAILCKKQKSIFELEKRTLSYELNDMYGKAYDELLKEVRRKQHDYKNQLSAIEGMLATSNSENRANVILKDYMKLIENENEMNSLLSKCYNSIIAGYIYTMYIRCKDIGNKLLTDVNVVTEDIDIKTKDIIEILGVFITNACEKIEKYDESKRIINLKLHNKKEKMFIEVRNIAEYVSYEEMSKMFLENYSTKGTNRGMGLYVVKRIAEKYSSEVHIKNIVLDGENWIVFNVEI